MNARSAMLLVGLGSPHGDDRAGWEVARLGAIRWGADENLLVRCAAAPTDLLDWLDKVHRLHVCDACCGGSPAGTVHCWTWRSETAVLVPADSPAVATCSCAPALRCASSHQLGLLPVLALADTLGVLPREVVVWGIEGKQFELEQPLSPQVASSAEEIVTRIAMELEHARDVPGPRPAQSS